MKEIIIYIRPNMYFQTKEALYEKGFTSMNSQLVYGHGKKTTDYALNTDADGSHEIAEYPFVAKKQINITVRDEDAQAVIDTVIAVNQTHTAGDGKIFVIPVEKAVRIRTKETNEDALM